MKTISFECIYQDDDNLQAQTAIAAGSKSTLPLAVQKLVRMIFDIESMKKALLEFEVKGLITVGVV